MGSPSGSFVMEWSWNLTETGEDVGLREGFLFSVGDCTASFILMKMTN